jgi:hypothetical protein
MMRLDFTRPLPSAMRDACQPHVLVLAHGARLVSRRMLLLVAGCIDAASDVTLQRESPGSLEAVLTCRAVG